SQGLVGYRDFFDNHTPLFHIVFAPLIAAIGETRHILFFGRLMMIPVAAASLVVTYFIASELYDRSVAQWAKLTVAVIPPFVLKSIEFRNDNLWVFCCLVVLALVLRPLTPRRAALAGLIAALS